MTELRFARVVDEGGLRAFHETLEAALAADFEALPADPIEDLSPVLSGRLDDQPTELLVGWLAGVAVANAKIRRSDRDNTEVANINLEVHPDHRGNGYGEQVAIVALARAKELGCTRALCEVPSRTLTADPAPAVALARRLGARPLITERRRVLDVDQLDQVTLADIVAETQSHAAGYSIVTWRDRTPPELVEDMAALTALMSTDPPQGDLALAPEVWDAERYLAHEQAVIDRGRQRLFAAARHDDSGRLAGFTDLAVPPGRPTVGFQWSTVVEQSHRGHRLGLLLKAINLQRLRTEWPFVRYLNTFNAEDNSHMVALNVRLGFRKLESWTEWGLDLA